MCKVGDVKASLAQKCNQPCAKQLPTLHTTPPFTPCPCSIHKNTPFSWTEHPKTPSHPQKHPLFVDRTPQNAIPSTKTPTIRGQDIPKHHSIHENTHYSWTERPKTPSHPRKHPLFVDRTPQNTIPSTKTPSFRGRNGPNSNLHPGKRSYLRTGRPNSTFHPGKRLFFPDGTRTTALKRRKRRQIGNAGAQ